MDSKQLTDLIDQLDDNLENLEEVLQPVLEDSLGNASKKLPILDRAKLNITVVYAIESLLFSYLRLNGVNAKGHEVFKELERVKRYFGKLKEVEDNSSIAKPSVTLNKQAAARIIQSSLASNGASDSAQRERELKERLIAMRKLKVAQASPASSSKSIADITPPPPTATAPAVMVPAEPLHTRTTIDEQSSAEEGEIEEDENVPITEAVPHPNHCQYSQLNNKRKHGQSISKKANKKARKKRKHAKNGN